MINILNVKKYKYIFLIIIILIESCSVLKNHDISIINSLISKNKKCVTYHQLKTLDSIFEKFMLFTWKSIDKNLFTDNIKANDINIFFETHYEISFIKMLNDSKINFDILSNYFSMLSKTKQVTKDIVMVYFTNILYIGKSTANNTWKMNSKDTSRIFFDYYLFYNTKKKLWVDEKYYYQGKEFKF